MRERLLILVALLSVVHLPSGVAQESDVAVAAQESGEQVDPSEADLKNSVGAWMGYPQTAPVYYDHGNNVTYQNDGVYVNGQEAGTTQQYYGEADTLAQSGAAAEAPSDGEWLPLGVFALTTADENSSFVTIQLAVNKQGIIRGNYTDTKTEKTVVIQGAIDKQTQRVAFTVGDNKSNLIETGLYNLTKDEAPALVHVGNDKTVQYLLVRLGKDKDAPAANG